MYIVIDTTTGQIGKYGNFPYNVLESIVKKGHNPICVSLDSKTIKYDYTYHLPEFAGDYEGLSETRKEVTYK